MNWEDLKPGDIAYGLEYAEIGETARKCRIMDIEIPVRGYIGPNYIVVNVIPEGAEEMRQYWSVNSTCLSVLSFCGFVGNKEGDAENPFMPFLFPSIEALRDYPEMTALQDKIESKLSGGALRGMTLEQLRRLMKVLEGELE